MQLTESCASFHIALRIRRALTSPFLLHRSRSLPLVSCIGVVSRHQLSLASGRSQSSPTRSRGQHRAEARPGANISHPLPCWATSICIMPFSLAPWVGKGSGAALASEITELTNSRSGVDCTHKFKAFFDWLSTFFLLLERTCIAQWLFSYMPLTVLDVNCYLTFAHYWQGGQVGGWDRTCDSVITDTCLSKHDYRLLEDI